MAPRDRSPDAEAVARSDDWFDDTVVVETDAAAEPSANAVGRRLTVLTDQHPADDSDDDWFRDVPAVEAQHPDADADAEDTFDTRTAMLRGRSSYSASPQPAPSWWRRHRAAVAVTTALAVLTGGAVGAVVLLTGGGGEPQSATPMALDEIVTTTAAPVPTSTAPAAAGAAAADVTWCKGQADGDPVTADSDDPGAAAIWRFEDAFYYDRDGAVARASGAPDAVMASAQRLQEGIDQLEPQVEFCVLADPIDAGVYDVTVVERGPGIDGRISRQRITTTEQQDGRTLISAIVPR